MFSCPHCKASLSDEDLAGKKCPHCGGIVPSGELTWNDNPASPTIDLGANVAPPPAELLQEFARTIDSDTFDSNALDSAGAAPPGGAPADASRGSAPPDAATPDAITLADAAPADADPSKTTPVLPGTSPTIDSSVAGDFPPPFGATIDSDQVPPGDQKQGTWRERPEATIDVANEQPLDVEQRLQGIWGESASRSMPNMTIKSGTDSGSAKTAQPTLVIQERGLRQAADWHVPTADYDLQGVLGEGGMGVVYTARQASIDREVALKMLKPEMTKSESQRRKFLSEAVVTGELDHPNIVPIYDLGRNKDGVLFYSMKKVQGTPWSRSIKQKSLIENLEVLLKVADAVAFAHARGVIHRDLKPENVMLGEFGEVLVLDWGLAVATAEHHKTPNVTTDLSMAGTPAYMAPELAVGPLDRIGKHSDIYLLGAMLYEIVTGKPPHPGRSARATLMAVARNEIAPTEKRGELVDIAKKAMSTRPEDRHASVRDFQEAVRQYQSHSESIALSERAQADLRSAIQNDDYSVFARALFGFEEALSLWKGNDTARAGVSRARLHYAAAAHRKADYDLGLSLLCDDDPAHAEIREQLQQSKQERDARVSRLRTARRIMLALAALVFVAVTTGIVLVSKFWRDAVDQAEIARQQKVEADRQTVIASEQRDEADRQRGEAERQRDEADRQKGIAGQERDKAQREKENAEYEAYTALIGMAAAKIDENAFQQAQQALADCLPDLRGWEWRRLMYVVGQGQGRRLPVGSRVECLAYGNGGSRLATGSRDGTVRVWDVSTGRQSSPAAGAHSQEQLAEYKLDQDAYVAAVAFSPAEPNLLAVGSNAPGGFLRLWNRDTGEARLLAGPKGHTAAVVSAAFSRDGKRLLTASLDNTSKLWDVASGAPLVTYGHSWFVWSAVFSPDEKTIATAGEDGMVRLWDTDSGKEWRTNGRKIPFAGHRGPVYAVAFVPKTAGQQAEEKAAGNQAARTSAAGRSLPGVGYIASAGYDTRVLLWRPEDLVPFDYKKLLADEQVPETPFVELAGHTAAVHGLRVSPDGNRLLSASYDHTLRIWYAHEEDAGYTIIRGGTLDKELRGHDGPVTAAAFDPVNSDVVASASFDGTARVWSIGQYHEQRPLPGIALRGHAEAVLSAQFSHDGKRIVTASRDRTAKTWRTGDGAEEITFREGHEYLASKAIFFPDGKHLLTAAVDSTVRIWNIATGAETRLLDGTGYRSAVALSPDGRWILTGSNAVVLDKREDGSPRALQVAQLWNAATGVKVHDLVGHKNSVSVAAFAAPERNLAFTGDDNGVGILWNVETGQQVARLEFHFGAIADAVFVPGRPLLLTAGTDGTVCQWDLSHVAAGNVAAGEVAAAEVGRAGADGPDPAGAEIAVAEVAAPEDTAAEVARPEPLYKLTLKHGKTVVTSLAVTPDGRRVLTGCEDGTARLWELDTARLLWKMTFSPPAGAEDGAAAAPAEAADDATPPKSKTNVNAVAIAPNGRQAIAVDSFNNIVRLLDLDDGREIMAAAADGPPKHFLDLQQHGALGWSAVFSPDGQRVATVGGNEACLWDMQGTELASFSPHRPVAFASFSPDDTKIVTAGWDNSARIWDARTGAALVTLASRATGDEQAAAAGDGASGHTAALNCAVFSPDGKRVLTASDDNTLRLWDAETGSVIRVFNQHAEAHQGGITRVVFFRDGTKFAAASRDGAASVWSADNGEQPLVRMTGHAAAVLDLALSPDERFLITGSADNTAKLWDVSALPAAAGGGQMQEAKELLTLEGHTGEVAAVAFGTDAKKLRALTGSADRTAKLWDVSALLAEADDEAEGGQEQKAKELLTLKGHVRGVTSVSFSPDGNAALTAGRDGISILWPALQADRTTE